MKIAQIERELKGRVNPRVVYWLQFLMENQIAIQQQLDECTTLLVNIVKVQQNLQHLMEGGFTKELEATLRNHSTDMVDSILPDEEE